MNGHFDGYTNCQSANLTVSYIADTDNDIIKLKFCSKRIRGTRRLGLRLM